MSSSSERPYSSFRIFRTPAALAAADDTAVAGAAGENLRLNDGVPRMAPGHDADIVLAADGDGGGNVVEIPQHNLLSGGEQGGIRKFRAVIHDDAAEAYVGQNRHQLLSYVPAAEYIDPTAGDDLLDVQVAAAIAYPVGLTGEPR